MSKNYFENELEQSIDQDPEEADKEEAEAEAPITVTCLDQEEA